MNPLRLQIGESMPLDDLDSSAELLRFEDDYWVVRESGRVLAELSTEPATGWWAVQSPRDELERRTFTSWQDALRFAVQS